MGKRILTEEQLQARREYGKRYRETHKEIERERSKRWRENNPEKAKENKHRYIKNNPDYYRLKYDRERAKIGKTRLPVLTEEEKETKRLERKEKARIRSTEYYKNHFVSVKKVCRYCGTPFMTQYKKSKVFCCEECAQKQEHYLLKIADKRRHGKITALDRLDKDITLPFLFKRDKGVCKICGGLCDYNDYEIKDGTIIVGNNYPSIDHIKPISKGGSHTWDNVQLSHKLCNSIKADKEAI